FMQISCDPTPFIILQCQDSTAETPCSLLSPFASGYVGIDFQPTHGLAAVISQCRPAAGDCNLGAILCDVSKFSLPAVGMRNFQQRHGKLSVKNFVDCPAEHFSACPAVEPFGSL